MIIASLPNRNILRNPMPNTNWKRPKVLPSETKEVETSCGHMYFTKCYEDDKLIEVRTTIGKCGTCSNIMLDSFCKLISIILQSEMPRYKTIKKLKKNFEGMNCGQPFKFEGVNYTGCHDYIIKSVVNELEK